MIKRGHEPGAGLWSIPGGRIEPGETDAEALVREMFEETGLAVEVGRLIGRVQRPGPNGTVINIRDYAATVTGGTLRNEVGGSSDLAKWYAPADVPGLVLLPYVSQVLDVPITYREQIPPARPVVVPGITRVQRFAAYGLVTDPAGRLLLTRIADGYPGAGTWHLPGGGTDFGEQATAGLLREMVEETDQRGRVIGLLDVMHLHRPGAMGPEGRPMDWHTVRSLYRAVVDEPTAPRVREVGGSTAEARWLDLAEVASLPLNGFAKDVLNRYGP